MTTPVLSTLGPVVVDNAGVLGETSQTFDLPKYYGGAKLHFGNITGLTGTLSASWAKDANGVDVFTNILSVMQDGTLVAAGGTVTAADDAELFFLPLGADKVKFTTAAGSGPISLIYGFGADEIQAVLLRKMLLSGLAVTPTQPDAIVGPSDPVIDSYQSIPINLAAGNNQVLVSSAANKQIWVYGIGFSVNAAGTVSFQDEDDTAITGIMPIATNGGFGIAPSGNFAMPAWKLGTNKDLEVDIVTSELDGWLSYAIVSV